MAGLRHTPPPTFQDLILLPLKPRQRTRRAVGALLAGVIADLVGMAMAIHVIAALTLLSGIVVAVRMYETHPTTS